MRRAFDLFASRTVTIILFVSSAFAYTLYLVMTGGQLVTLSQGVDVLGGGTDIPNLIATRPIVAIWVATILAHVLARLVLRVIRLREEPTLSALDCEDILATADAFTVVAPVPDWTNRARETLDDTWFIADDSADRAVFWTNPHAVARNAWRFALWFLFLAAFVSMLTRSAAYVRLGDGQLLGAPLEGALYRYDWRFPQEGERVPLGRQALGIVQGSITPALDASSVPVPSGVLARPVTADIVFGDPDDKSVRVGMWPPAVIGGSLASLTDVGVAPKVIVVRGEQTLSDRYVPVAIMPGASSVGELKLGGGIGTLSLALLPGDPVPNATYQAVYRAPDGSELASGLVGAGASIEVSGTSITIADTQWWVGLSIVRDPGLWMFLGGLLALLLSAGVWIWTAATGWQRYSFVVADTEHGPRLYIGADSSVLARRRTERRLSELARTLDKGRGGVAADPVRGGAD